MKWPFWIRIILTPFSWIYGFILAIRNAAFDWQWLKTTKFSVPIICVGNLSTGGTGKTPMVEYLLTLFNNKSIAIVSRGYGRTSQDIIIANAQSTAAEIGDEPLQYVQKFPNCQVVVGASRVEAVTALLKLKNGAELIVLDDAFQHRSIAANVQILLTAYDDLYIDDFVLPAGNLRERISGASRANIIVVNKCPLNFSIENAQKMTKKIKLLPHQKIFFSAIDYHSSYDFYTKEFVDFTDRKIILLAAIAKPEPLLDYIKSKTNLPIKVMQFKDHHFFTEDDINNLLIIKKTLNDDNTLILTTEKDATRLLIHKRALQEARLEIAIIPISLKILLQQESLFYDTIVDKISMQQST